MNSEKITEVINKIPFLLLLLGYLASLGYDYYTFVNDASSPLGLKKAELIAVKGSNAKLQIKVTELENFVKTLEAKKVELRRLVEEFQLVSGSLPDRVDTPLFMKMIITEAKKIGLKVESLKPKGEVEKEFYLETIFSFSFRGLFGQLLVFLQRLANTTEIIRIDEIEIKPNSAASARFVEIKGDLEIRTYTYLTAKAEAMVKKMASNSETSDLGSAKVNASTPGTKASGGNAGGGPSGMGSPKMPIPGSPASPHHLTGAEP